jgi:hypothetical protein
MDSIAAQPFLCIGQGIGFLPSFIIASTLELIYMS